MTDTIELMRNAFAELSSGNVSVPQRITMEMPSEDSRSLVMPAYSPATKRYSMKVVTLSGNNPSKKLPFIHGLLMVFDSDTGRPLALMDAEYITALRTGAASGLATNLLARADAKVAMIFGAGAQARTQLEGIAAARRLDRALVFSPDKSRVEQFCGEMRLKLDLEVNAARLPEEVRQADIVCTATTSQTPVFNDKDIKPGTHVNGIGSHKATVREIPSETVKRSKVIVDSKSAALKEAGDVMIAIQEGAITADDIHAEIGEIALGRKPGRENQEEITLFKSVGNAVQDLAVASRVFELSEKMNFGSLANL